MVGLAVLMVVPAIAGLGMASVVSVVVVAFLLVLVVAVSAVVFVAVASGCDQVREAERWLRGRRCGWVGGAAGCRRGSRDSSPPPS